MTAGRAGWIAGLGFVALAAACGRKDSPLPPLRPDPGRITDTHLRRIDDRVEVRFTIPAANADGTTPSLLDRVEIYAMATPSGAAAPTMAQVVTANHLKGLVPVRHDSAKPVKKGAPAPPPDPRPAPGDVATFVDRAGTDKSGADAPVLRYVVVGVIGRAHKGPAAAPLDMPLAPVPPAPQRLASSFDEQHLTFSWQAAAPGQQFRVYDVNAAGASIDPARVPAAQSATSFTVPVVFDVARCVAVRAVQESGPVIIEGQAAGPKCVTPDDHFPPPVPADVLAFALDGVVNVTWGAVEAKDLAGYLVLRGAVGGDKLQPLMTKAVPDLHYTDRDVRPGTTYEYAVQAVDLKGNASALSDRQRVTVRIP